MVWVGRGASAPGRLQAACQLQSLVSRRLRFSVRRNLDDPFVRARRTVVLPLGLTAEELYPDLYARATGS